MTTLYVRQENGRYAIAPAPVILDLASDLLRKDLIGTQALGSPDQVRRFLRHRISHLEHEVFCVLLLDNRNRVLDFVELFRGTIDGCSVHPREVAKLVLQRNAAAIILAHNHPSGIPEPSQADEIITRRLKSALALIDVRVLDHLVIGHDTQVSFAERGIL